MQKYQFIYTIVEREGEEKLESTAFLADDETSAQVSVEAFVLLRLGMLYKPERLEIQWATEKRIFGVSVGESMIDRIIPILVGEIHDDVDVQAEIQKRKESQADEADDEGNGEDLKGSPDLPSV